MERDRREKLALSVIVPAYNEAAFIAGTMRELIAYLAAWPGTPELIMVDDGSTDRTAALLVEAVVGTPIAVHVVRNARNQGKGVAICRGMQIARGDARVFLDADLAYPPEEIARLCAALADGADVAVACRVHPSSRCLVSPSSFRRAYARHLAGRVFNRLVRLVLLPEIRDSQAGLKGFTAAAADQLFSGRLPRGFGFDLALLSRARQLGLKIAQVPVFYRHVTHTTSVRFLRDTVAMLRDLAQLRMRSSKRDAPSTGAHDPPSRIGGA